MAAPKASFAEALGVPPDLLEGDIKIRRPEDPQASQRAHEIDLARIGLARLLAWLGSALMLLLSWLFLHYGGPDQAKEVVALLAGFVGGVGIGRYTPLARS